LSYTREAVEGSSGRTRRLLAFAPMQFARETRDAVADGTVTLTFRRWARPHAVVGGHHRVGAVTIEIDEVELVPFGTVTDAEARRAGHPHREALRAITAHSGPVADDTLVYRIEFHVV